MSIKQEFREAREKFRLLSLYQRFEHFVVMFLTALIVVIVVAALWSLTLKILFGLVLSREALTHPITRRSRPCSA
jgi:hypothetical protein